MLAAASAPRRLCAAHRPGAAHLRRRAAAGVGATAGIRRGEQPRHLHAGDPPAALSGRQPVLARPERPLTPARSEEHTSELQSLMRTSYAVFCLNNKNPTAPTAPP